MNITVFTSGILGYKTLKKISENDLFHIIYVFTDKGSCDIIEFCKQNNIPFFVGNPRRLSYKVKLFVAKYQQPDIFFSINYRFIIDNFLINLPRLYALNIHGSLLPKYRGRTPHVWAIINGEKITGITVHKIIEKVDAGDILLQHKIDISDKDTGADILFKFEKMYPELVEESIRRIINKREKFVKQNHVLATYFGKRVPDDGKIDWNWQKERIYNWVRAQANPYPGAFSFYDNNKLIINKIKFSDLGFDYNLLNGTILCVNPLIVKTPNGAIEIQKFYFENNNKIISFKLKSVLK
jgi:methionyl-tRNA formyltransferase